jgi:hypothetical protein
VAAALVIALELAGCATRAHLNPVDPGYRQGTVSPVALAATREVPRLTLDLHDVAAPGSDRVPAQGGPVQALADEACVDLAARGSILGNLLESKAADCCQATSPAIPPPHPLHRPTGESRIPAVDLRAEMLRVAALEARNQSAGTALEVFYRLMQAVGQRDAALGSLATVDRALQERKKLIEQGVTIPTGLDRMDARRMDVASALSELDQAIHRASAELRHQLLLDPPDSDIEIRPLVDIRGGAPPNDPEAEVQIGLARRPEVQLLRCLDGMQTPETLKALETSLTAVSPLLAISCAQTVPAHHFAVLDLLAQARVGADERAHSLPAVRRAWDTYRTVREREIAKEIRVAAQDVRATFDRVGIAQQRIKYWQSEIARITSRSKQDFNTFAEGIEAELMLLEAQGTLWGKVGDWQVARARLRRAQFLLP